MSGWVNTNHSQIWVIRYALPKSLHFAILYSVILQAQRLKGIGQVSLCKKLLLLPTSAKVSQPFQAFISEIHNLNLLDPRENLEKYEYFQNFFTEHWKMSTKETTKSFCNKVSKALNIVICEVSQENEVKHFGGTSVLPIMISIYKENGTYYPAIQMYEFEFDHNQNIKTSKVLYHEIEEEDQEKQIELLIEFKNAVLFIAPNLENKFNVKLKNAFNRIEPEFSVSLETDKFLKGISVSGECIIHNAFECFECKTVHCRKCLRDSKECPCGITISPGFHTKLLTKSTSFVYNQSEEVKKEKTGGKSTTSKTTLESDSVPSSGIPISNKALPDTAFLGPILKSPEGFNQIPNEYVSPNNEHPGFYENQVFQYFCNSCANLIEGNDPPRCNENNMHTFCCVCFEACTTGCPTCMNLICIFCQNFVPYGYFETTISGIAHIACYQNYVSNYQYS